MGILPAGSHNGSQWPSELALSHSQYVFLGRAEQFCSALGCVLGHVFGLKGVNSVSQIVLKIRKTSFLCAMDALYKMLVLPASPLSTVD